jgi:hypothetical protein
MKRQRDIRTHNRDRFKGARLNDEERKECASIMERLRGQKPARFATGTSTLVVLKEIAWREAEGSSGDLICCIVRNGVENTWMLRGKNQMKGSKEKLRVKKILWA